MVDFIIGTTRILVFKSSARKLVIQLYLNTIEEGGETEFLYINKRIKAEQGRLIIFPAAFTHTHRGNPPYWTRQIYSFNLGSISG